MKVVVYFKTQMRAWGHRPDLDVHVITQQPGNRHGQKVQVAVYHFPIYYRFKEIYCLKIPFEDEYWYNHGHVIRLYNFLINLHFLYKQVHVI